jgi:circadian clock protein KaiC
LPLLATGIPGFDTVLGGGVPAGDLALIVGDAGSGKTTIALQTAFHLARSGSATCFVSTTSEAPGRLLEHARSYAFYDESRVGKELLLLSIYPLIQKGLGAVRAALEAEVRQHGARLLVLDGLSTLHDLHSETAELRRFVYELGDLLSTLGCAILLTSSRTEPSDVHSFAEFTMADALVRLSQSLRGTRSERHLQVVKVRGRAPVLGLHTARIDREGFAVFPRFESLAHRGEITPAEHRAATGLPELDAMTGGGFPACSVTAVAGATGTGKTLLALQFLLEGAENGEPGLLVSLRETREEMTARGRRFGLDLSGRLQDGTIRFEHHAPVDLEPDRMVHALEAGIAALGRGRFVLDGADDLLLAIPDEGRRVALGHVVSGLLRSRGISAMVPLLVPAGVGPELDLEHTPMAALAQNLVLLRYVEYAGELQRILSILKLRDSDFDASIRRYVIGSSGFRLLPRTEADAGLLAAIAGLPSEARVKRPGEPERSR